MLHNFDDRKVVRLQNNLTAIRKTAGWSMEDLAVMLGVSRQTVNNWEKGTSRLSKTAYLAIRALLDAKMYVLHDNANAKILGDVINALVDDEFVSKESQQNILDAIEEATKKVRKYDGSKALAEEIVLLLRR